MKQSILRPIIAVTIVLGAIALGLVAFVWSGIYGIGADDPHIRPVHAMMTKLRNRSVETSARDVPLRDLRDAKMVASGAKNYSEMCVGCHLAPGVTQSELRAGLYPQPPNLSEPAARDPRQAFWVIKHGIKMSAMPAWGRSHDDDAIWALVAFISSMPTMPVALYQRLAGAEASEHGVSHDMQPNSMQGMEHGQTKGMQADSAKGSSAGMDHSQMQGMQSGAPKGSMPGMDHSQMQGAQSGASQGSMPGMDHSQMQGMQMDSAKGGAMAAGKQRNSMRGMDMARMQGGKAPPEARDPDAYAEGLSPGPMLGMDMSDHRTSFNLRLDKLELSDMRADRTLRLDAQAWIGGDYEKLWLKADGERVDGRQRATRTEALWNHAIASNWSSQAGVRHDFSGGPGRSWTVLGVQGLAPYWFNVEASAYLGEAGRTAARVEVEYDILFTQRLILQPNLEITWFGKGDPARGIGRGVSEVEAGARLRYEMRRQFAPYIGLQWKRKFGKTADLAHASGEAGRETQAVAGVRIWF